MRPATAAPVDLLGKVRPEDASPRAERASERPMRLLMVTQYYWPEDFSAGIYMPELAESLC